MKPRYLSGDKASTVFAQMMRRALPGNGNAAARSGSAVSQAGSPPVSSSNDPGIPLLGASPSLSSASGADNGAASLITEADIAAKVQNTVGTGPDFDTGLLADPEYDRRATAIPAAREEQE